MLPTGVLNIKLSFFGKHFYSHGTEKEERWLEMIYNTTESGTQYSQRPPK